ncbi:MAG: GNAT family N-acetyltransferase [Archangiaceae bacterium]|nr:GNAT family N-acetyltransferase [Archangiaceae bacterium]
MRSVLRVQVLKSVSEVPPEVWNALVPRGTAPVMKHAWLHAMESSGSATAKTGWEPHHFAAYDGSNLVGLAPAWRKSHSMGEYIYDWGWANAASQFGVRYHPKLLIGAPLSPITAPKFLGSPAARAELVKAAIASAKKQGLSTVHILFPPEDEALELEQLDLGLFRRKSMQYHWRNAGYRTYDDYLARFDSKRRNQLKRERGAAATQGITIRTVRGKELGVEHARLAFKFYESTCEKNGWGTVQLNQKFFERAFAAMPDEVELVVAERAGKPVAGAFNLVGEKRLYGRYWGCFEDHPFLHFNVCLYHSVDECIRAGREAFEPGAGGEHKIPRGFEPTQINSLHLAFEPAFDRALRDACRREAQHVDQVVAQSRELAGMKPV